jgi:hypothetical protein
MIVHDYFLVPDKKARRYGNGNSQDNRGYDDDVFETFKCYRPAVIANEQKGPASILFRPFSSFRGPAGLS